jgi:hypothetical protein
VGARSRWVPASSTSNCVLTVRNRSGPWTPLSIDVFIPLDVSSEYTARSLSDFGDYDHPGAASGLVKCALLCLGLVSHPAATPAVPSQHSYPHGEFPELSQQLHATFGGSLEVELWSVLPQGSVSLTLMRFS